MDLHQIRTFVTVAETSSITKAASLLFLSQPAISAQIKALESEFNIKLFHRTHHGVELTPSGALVRDEAKIALEAIKKLSSCIENPINEQIALGTIAVPLILNLPSVLSELKQRCKNVRLNITQNISGIIIEKVLNGELDAGFIIGEVNDPSIDTLILSPITLCVVGPWSWREDLKKADFEAIKSFPWIVTPKKCSYTKILQNFLGDSEINVINSSIVTDQEVTLVDLVSMEMGVTLMREDIALLLQDKKEVFIWQGRKIESCLSFIWKKQQNKNVVTDLVAIVQSLWGIS